MINESLKYKRRKDLETDNSDMETLIIELKSDRENTLIASCYRAPSMDQKKFIESYQSQLETLTKYSKNVIIGLDHNMDLLKSSNHKLTSTFFEMNLMQGMYSCITKPTRITHSTAMLIDNIFCSQEMYRNSKSGIAIDNLSDHLPCYSVIESFKPTEISEQLIYK